MPQNASSPAQATCFEQFVRKRTHIASPAHNPVAGLHKKP
jgi:hypothetical protein